MPVSQSFYTFLVIRQIDLEPGTEKKYMKMFRCNFATRHVKTNKLPLLFKKNWNPRNRTK